MIAFSNIHPWQNDQAVMQVLVFNNEEAMAGFNKIVSVMLETIKPEDINDSGIGAILKLRAVRDSDGNFIPIIRSGYDGKMLAEYESVPTFEEAIEVCRQHMNNFIQPMDIKTAHKLTCMGY